MKLRLHPVAVAVLALAGCGGQYRLDRSVRPEQRPSAALSLQWKHDLVPFRFLNYKPQEFASAAISPGGVVFVGSTARHFDAFRARDGKLLWSFTTAGAVSSTPLYHAATKTVFFGADDGHMYALDARTGQLKWRYATQGIVTPRPVYDEGLLLFTTSEERVYALDAATGKWRWQYEREAPEGFTIRGYAGVTVLGSLAYTGFADGILVALRVATGEVVWTRNLSGGKTQLVDVDATPVPLGEGLVTASFSSGVYVVNPEDGAIKWQYAVEGVTGITVEGSRAYFTTPKKGVLAMDSQGTLLWSQAIGKGISSAPVIVGPLIFVTNSEKGLFMASARTGKLLTYFAPGSGISAAPASALGLLVVLGNRGTLYTFAIAGPASPAA